jgi:hypothetical protein
VLGALAGGPSVRSGPRWVILAAPVTVATGAVLSATARADWELAATRVVPGWPPV